MSKLKGKRVFKMGSPGLSTGKAAGVQHGSRKLSAKKYKLPGLVVFLDFVVLSAIYFVAVCARSICAKPYFRTLSPRPFFALPSEVSECFVISTKDDL
jgi:hypothetical protein